MTTARQLWKAAYRAARIAIPAGERGRLSYDRMTGDWTKTPRYGASILLRDAVMVSLAAFGAYPDGDFDRLWRHADQAETALRPVESLQQKLGETVLNGFGYCATYYARHALSQRRHALINRMKARGLLIRDPSNHIREWGGFNGPLTSDRYADFINQSGARTA